MGDIADMHIAAYEAGLDPNEMDGADWADFLSNDEPPSRAECLNLISGDCRMLLCWIDDLQEGKFDASTEVRAKALSEAVPDFSEAEATTLIDLLVKLNTAALAEEDRLEAEGSAE